MKISNGCLPSGQRSNGLQIAASTDIDNLCSYVERKRREIALLDRCLRTPLHPAESVAAVVEQKFRLAALLKADQLLERWSITETARTPGQWTRVGPFAFRFGYQRADLEVRGPPIYPMLHRLRAGGHESTIYTGSGMGAIAALLNALLQFNDIIEVVVPNDCYGETRELMTKLGSRIRVLPSTRYPCVAANERADARVLWLDSSVHRSFSAWLAAITPDFDLAVFDTTCFWRSSTKVGRAVRQAMRMGLPIALVRSHGKLDSLGIEYGRLGSVVLVTPKPDPGAAASRWISSLAPKIQDAVRLFGAAPILAHFPPFESGDDYQACSAMRTASIIRNTRRLAQVLRSKLPTRRLTVFQHGLYLTIALNGDACVDSVKRAASEMAKQLAIDGFPVKHAGSFGFDFVGVEWCPDPIDRTNSIRITGADLPLGLIDGIGQRIAAWWLRELAAHSHNALVLTDRKAAA
jgi:hypothetical protein